MPQMNKGGKFIFGRSLIREDGRIQLPDQAVREYDAASEGWVILFTGSKSTGGFCVTRPGLLEPSQLGHILKALPELTEGGPGHFLPYKGRSYCWVSIGEREAITLTAEMMEFLNLAPGMSLLAIRSSDIAFTMGAKGPLLERAAVFPGEIPLY